MPQHFPISGRSLSHMLLAVSATLMMIPANSTESSAVRIALVMGNGRYEGAPLQNPVSDARAVAQLLREMKFDVIEAEDADKAAMAEALERARNKLKEGHGTILVYYAGHGVQLNWHNYLVPIGADLTSAEDAPTKAVGVPEMIDALRRAGSAEDILILDACRDNPFSERASGKGLAQMDAPASTFLAYSTAPGNTASDGEGSHGLYTDALLREMARPGQKIEDILKRVRLEVRIQSHGAQIPWESTSLEDDFYFIPPKEMPATNAAANAAQMEKELGEWDKIKESTRPADYVTYLRTFPSGYYAEAAQFRLDHLQAPAVRPQPSPVEIDSGTPGKPLMVQERQLVSGSNRYHLGDDFYYKDTNMLTQQSRVRESKVTFADDNRVEFNNGANIQDQMGNLIKNRYSTKDPFNLVAPSDLALGKKWHTAFRSTNPAGEVSTVYYDYKVTALENVTVPAGTFTAFRIEGNGFAFGARSSTPNEVVYWIDPRTFFAIKSITKFGRPGSMLAYDIEELVSFAPGPG